MKLYVAFLGIGMAIFTSMAWAADLPRKSEHDERVRYVIYKTDDVAVINVRRGVVTRLILEEGERILHSGTGFSAQCNRDELEWCIRADKDSNQIWVKPRRGATHNNLELATNRRDYSIRFNVLPDVKKGVHRGEDMYRVIFQYPKSPYAKVAIEREKSELNTRLAMRPRIRNADYSVEVLAGGEYIQPTLVFDDGRFTYFRFPNSREMPAPFAIGADGQEVRVNFNIDGDLMVVHRIAPRFVLRLGKAVAGIWNEVYDHDGVATDNGTVVPDVYRATR